MKCGFVVTCDCKGHRVKRNARRLSTKVWEACSSVISSFLNNVTCLSCEIDSQWGPCVAHEFCFGTAVCLAAAPREWQHPNSQETVRSFDLHENMQNAAHNHSLRECLHCTLLRRIRIRSSVQRVYQTLQEMVRPFDFHEEMPRIGHTRSPRACLQRTSQDAS